MGVSGKGHKGDRRNFCTLRETTGLKSQRKKAKNQHKGKKSDEQRYLINPALEAGIINCRL